MMKTFVPIKSPQLLVRPIDDQHVFVVNCAYPNSLRILSRAQSDILAAIDNQTSIVALSEKFGIATDVVEEFLNLLARTEIIRFDQQFSVPRKPASPKSLNFWIHTTNRCNLTCSYCYISTLNTTPGMSEATRQQLLSKMIETVRKRGLTSIKLRLAGGEPLSQFKAWKTFIPQAKRTLKDIGCQLECSFITNLTILTNEIVAFSKEYGISYGISLDGLDVDHDNTRTFKSGAGSFSIIDRNLRTLLAHHIPVSTNTVVTNSNLAGLPRLTRYLIDLDVPFRYSIVKGEAIDTDMLDQYLSESYDLMKDAIGQGWRFSQRHQFCDLKPSELGFQTCASGFSGGAIYVDGSVNYCHVHFGDESQVSYSLFATDMDLVDMIQQGSHYEDMKSQDCQSCRYRSVCNSGCPVYRVNGKDPQCSLYHRFIPLIYELQARERLKLLQDCRMIA
ncbi:MULTISPECIES: radical SAM protein [unclassified Spirosoma]|uniref:radical SAM/SPASM domain-containing protein n=1 Tax=unclassified Spirosoma TaxID=2621999 RepID=UPI000961C54E|nr:MULTISPECIES: radical SAM protein [unclassified Spirosoma]MBN8824098.1 radical SAM protein [Spirosoma sp.]OJW70495.1 MAG: radical SAM/SPASM domain-containing protein [Spirosoma sp. 48-14]